MTPEFEEAKRRRRRRIERWQNGSSRRRRLALILKSCRRGRRCGRPECHVCQLLDRRRKARANRAAEAVWRPPDQVAPSGIATRASDIAPEALDWLWWGRIPRGKVTVLAGQPGLGKSQLAAFLAAKVSKGGEWPFGEGKASLGSVLIVIAEDGAGDTVISRLKVMNADLSRIHLMDVNKLQRNGCRFDLLSDINLLEQELSRLADVQLVVIDPIAAVLKSPTQQRAAGDRLQELGKRFNVAIVAVSHLTKAPQSTALNQVMGGIGLVAAARAVFVIAPENGTDRRLFLTVKNNLSAAGLGLAYRVEPKSSADGIASSTIVWDPGPVMISADAALTLASRANKQPARTEAEDFLRLVLCDGSMPAKQVMSEASEAGVSHASLRRAAEALRVRRSAGVATPPKECGIGNCRARPAPRRQLEVTAVLFYQKKTPSNPKMLDLT